MILLVEDSMDDVFLLSEALEDREIKAELRHVTHSQAARDYIEGTGPFALRTKHPFPDVVVSDSKLTTRECGMELLKWIRTTQSDTKLPFILLTGASSPQQIALAEAAGVTAVVLKSVGFREVCDQIASILKLRGSQENRTQTLKTAT